MGLKWQQESLGYERKSVRVLDGLDNVEASRQIHADLPDCEILYELICAAIERKAHTGGKLRDWSMLGIREI